MCGKFHSISNFNENNKASIYWHCLLCLWLHCVGGVFSDFSEIPSDRIKEHIKNGKVTNPEARLRKVNEKSWTRNGTTGLIAADSLFLDENLKSKVTQDRSSANLSVHYVLHAVKKIIPIIRWLRGATPYQFFSAAFIFQQTVTIL